ncbi:MAG: HAMP domain-containing protein [Methylobacter sp.]|nr:MAG: HAMP domain-containing protein [Methylobacter sp.]
MIKPLLSRHSLARRLVAGLLLISIIPLAGLALLNLRNFEAALTRTVIADVASIADKKAVQIDTYINERRIDMHQLSHFSDIRDIFTALQAGYSAGIDSAAYRQATARAETLLAELATGYDYHDMLLINPAGEVIFSLKKESDFNTNMRTGPYRDTVLGQGFQRSMALLSTEFSAFDIYEPSGNKMAAFITTPLLSNGIPIGVLAARMNLEILQPVLEDRTGLGETGEAILAEQIQDLVTYTSHLHHANGGLLGQIPIEKTAPPMRQALHGERGQDLSADYAGHDVVAAWRYLPSLHWGMVVKIDSREVLAPLIQLQLHTALVLGALVLMSGAAAFFFGFSIITPLHHFIKVINEIAHGDLTQRVVSDRQDELGQLAVAFNQMADRVQSGRDTLEQTVITRTAELTIAKNDAETALNTLQQAQGSLVQAEKMAALGGLVAGISHEINTPVGVILMSSTHLKTETDKVSERYNQGELSGDELEGYFETARQAVRLMIINSQRAAELINSFKQVAVDQTSGERREFELKSYIEEILLSLRPKFKRTDIGITLECPENLIVDNYPGALSQILTNFITNSLQHAYQPGQAGKLNIRVTLLPDDNIRLVYSDDGQGIPEELQSKIFDPFFTTQRGSGGSGLGLHIVYNIIHQTLKGRLQMHSALAQGTTFTLHFPRVCPNTINSE